MKRSMDNTPMKPIETADFGKTAADYSSHRAGFPASLFDRLKAWQIGTGNQTIVDLGTGTGSLARGFARNNNRVIGIDPAPAMLAQACRIDAAEGLQIEYLCASAERSSLPANYADVVSAGQCWHWFDRARATEEVSRILVPGGTVVIAHYDWIPLQGNLVRETEKLIEAHNPAWRGGNFSGLYPQWLRDLGEAGYQRIETFSYDEAAVYTAESWRDRVRASAGIAASLEAAAVSQFDADLKQLLASSFADEGLHVPHRVFAVRAVYNRS